MATPFFYNTGFDPNNIIVSDLNALGLNNQLWAAYNNLTGRVNPAEIEVPEAFGYNIENNQPSGPSVGLGINIPLTASPSIGYGQIADSLKMMNNILPLSKALGTSAYLTSKLIQDSIASKLPYKFRTLYEKGLTINQVGAMAGIDVSGVTTADSVLAATPVLGFINAAGGKRSMNFSIDNNIREHLGSSYTGAYSFMDNVKSKAGKRFGLVSNPLRKELNRNTTKANIMLGNLGFIDKDALDTRSLGENTTYTQALKRLWNINNYSTNYTQLSKNGGVLDRIRRIASNDNIDTFLKGGSFLYIDEDLLESFISSSFDYHECIDTFLKGGSFNVIPGGALHAHKHHMENDENITKKGIPVVATENGEQQAEIEREEVTFRLEVSKKIEELLKKYESSEYTLKEKDLFAIECGQLLVYELLENTVDNANLISKIE